MSPAKAGNNPIAVMDRTSRKPLVVDSSAVASAVAGMILEQATSSHNELIILDADEPYYRRVFEDVIEALLQVGVNTVTTSNSAVTTPSIILPEGVFIGEKTLD